MTHRSVTSSLASYRRLTGTRKNKQRQRRQPTTDQLRCIVNIYQRRKALSNRSCVLSRRRLSPRFGARSKRCLQQLARRNRRSSAENERTLARVHARLPAPLRPSRPAVLERSPAPDGAPGRRAAGRTCRGGLTANAGRPAAALYGRAGRGAGLDSFARQRRADRDRRGARPQLQRTGTPNGSCGKRPMREDPRPILRAAPYSGGLGSRRACGTAVHVRVQMWCGALHQRYKPC